MTLRNELLLSASALRHNLKRVRELAPNSGVLSVVKANAYGHGSVWVAQTLKHSDKFGVAHVDEARELRDAGIKQPIVLLEGVSGRQELLQAVHLDCELVVHQLSQLKLLQDVCSDADFSAQFSSHRFPVWLKINTGMNRLGFNPAEAVIAWSELRALSNVQALVMMTHFACADELAHPLNKKQLDGFYGSIEQIKAAPVPELSCANSAAIIQLPDSHHQWVRPGLMLYGASPIAEKTAQDFGLKPVMCLRAQIIALQFVRAKETVGYAAQWTANKDSTIAVVSIGYGDGYPVSAPEGTPVVVNGQRAGIVGRVTMDMLMADVSHLSDVCEGDVVELWGEQLAIEEVADKVATIPYELMCRMTNRVKKVIVD